MRQGQGSEVGTSLAGPSGHRNSGMEEAKKPGPRHPRPCKSHEDVGLLQAWWHGDAEQGDTIRW